MTNKKVAEVYADGKTTGQSLHMFIDGKTIFSYGYHFPIAYKVNEKIALFNSDGYSNTTVKHKNCVRRALTSRGYTLIELPTGAINDYMEKDPGVKEKTREYFNTVIEEATGKANRARSEYMREYWANRITDLKKQKELFASV